MIDLEGLMYLICDLSNDSSLYKVLIFTPCLLWSLLWYKDQTCAVISNMFIERFYDEIENIFYNVGLLWQI